MKQLKIGIVGQIFPPAENALASAVRAERLGWDFINYPDQLTGTHPTGLLNTPVTAADPTAPTAMYNDLWMGSFEMCAAAAVLTSKIDILQAVVDPFRRSPALMAQQMYTLNLLSAGRMTFAFGSGEAKQFEPYGEKRIKPNTRLEEAIRIYKALWSSGGEPISRDSEFWPLTGAVFPLARHEAPHPQLLMVGGTEKVLTLAGELCEGWLTYLPGGVMDDVEVLAGMISAMKAAAERVGRDPESLRFVGMLMSCVAPTDEQAWKLARHPAVSWGPIPGAAIASGVAWKKFGYENPLGNLNWATDMNIEMVTEQKARELCAQVPDDMLHHCTFIGSPATVAERLQPFIDAGINELEFFNIANSADPENAAYWDALGSEIRVRLGCSPLVTSAPEAATSLNPWWLR